MNMTLFKQIITILLYAFAWINILNGGVGLNLALSNEIPFNVIYVFNFVIGIVMLFIVEERILEKMKNKLGDINE